MPTTPRAMPRTRVDTFQCFQHYVSLGWRDPLYHGGGSYCREFLIDEILRYLRNRPLMWKDVGKRRLYVGVRIPEERRNYNPDFNLTYWVMGMCEVHFAVANRVAKLPEAEPAVRKQIWRAMDRLLGVSLAVMFPGAKDYGRKETKNHREFWYQLPTDALVLPVFTHFSAGVMRMVLQAYARGVLDYLIEAATDEEVKRAMNGDTQLAKDILDAEWPNARRFLYDNYSLIRDIGDNSQTIIEEARKQPTLYAAWHSMKSCFWGDGHKAITPNRPMTPLD